MNIIVTKIGENRNVGMRYESWLKNYVKTGIANRYVVYKYPNIVCLVIVNGDGFVIHRKLEEYQVAKQLVDLNPSTYRIKKIDQYRLNKRQMKWSRRINIEKNMRWFNPLKYATLFRNFIISLFYWELHQVENNQRIRLTKKRIAKSFGILLLILSILVPLYIAYKQGVKLF